MTVKNELAVVWDVTPYRLLRAYGQFGEGYYLHLQCRRVSKNAHTSKLVPDKAAPHARENILERITVS
jgi:hypothetical protein